jgi:hypothetical protein
MLAGAVQAKDMRYKRGHHGVPAQHFMDTSHHQVSSASDEIMEHITRGGKV